MREILPGVLIWSWFSEPHGYDFDGTLVLDDGGNLCIDPVEPSDQVLEFDAVLVGDGVSICTGGHECLRQLVRSFPPE